MFLELSHTKLDVYQTSKKFVLECYKISRKFPAEENFNLTSQVRRAALSVHLNIAEGASRKSAIERKRYFEISRGSIVEIDAALDIVFELNYLSKEEMNDVGELLVRSFQMISKMIYKS